MWLGMGLHRYILHIDLSFMNTEGTCKNCTHTEPTPFKLFLTEISLSMSHTEIPHTHSTCLTQISTHIDITTRSSAKHFCTVWLSQRQALNQPRMRTYIAHSDVTHAHCACAHDVRRHIWPFCTSKWTMTTTWVPIITLPPTTKSDAPALLLTKLHT